MARSNSRQTLKSKSLVAILRQIVPDWPPPLAALLMMFATFEIIYVTSYIIYQMDTGGQLFGDFFAFWSYSKFSHVDVVNIYDTGALNIFEHKLWAGFTAKDFYPYSYSPIFLLYIWPLGWLSYLPSYCLWMTTTFCAYLAAVGGSGWRSGRVWLAVVAPTTVLSIVSGQNGLLTAALMIGGFRVIGRRPFLGGMLLGGLAFKPQLFILVPLVLLASRRWRSLAGLVTSVLGLVGASVAAFGLDVWLRWPRALATQWELLEHSRQRLSPLLPTVTVSLMSAGVDRGVAEAIQVIAAVAVAGFLWVTFRRSAGTGAAPRPLDVAALQVSVFLATPYAFIYDMPMVTSAVGTTIETCTKTNRPWRTGEMTVLIAVLLLPLLLLSGVTKYLPVGPLALLCALIVIARAGWTSAK